jgi:hypothetical protein
LRSLQRLIDAEHHDGAQSKRVDEQRHYDMRGLLARLLGTVQHAVIVLKMTMVLQAHHP